MTNHDHQPCMMHDMGFPQDSLEVIKESTRNTAIALPVGDTANIPLLRGTVQGDPLSPLLFLPNMEPLLRWLAVGGRGYKFACLPPDAEAAPHATSLPATGFVDDTNVITNTVADLRWPRLTPLPPGPAPQSMPPRVQPPARSLAACPPSP